MTRRVPIPRPCCTGREETPAVLTAAHWREQAALAEEYAHARPASDMAGFFSSMRDAERFRAMADQDLLRQCIASGQVSAEQAVAHHAAGETSAAAKAATEWWRSLSEEERAARIRRAF